MIDFPVNVTVQIGTDVWHEEQVQDFVELYRALENRRLDYVLAHTMHISATVSVTVTFEGYDPVGFILDAPRQSVAKNGYGMSNLEYMLENAIETQQMFRYLSTEPKNYKTTWEDLL